MADGRKNNGGHSTKGRAGRPPKAQEHKLIESLSPMHPDAMKAFKKALKEEQGWAVKLYMEYYYGKPKQSMDMDVTTNGQNINFTPINFVGGNKDK